jgi:hypothetical protein
MTLLNHSSSGVREIAQRICGILVSQFPQAIVLDLVNHSGLPYVDHLISVMQHGSPVIFSQMTFISTHLTQIANSLYGQWISKLTDAMRLVRDDDMESAVGLIRGMKPTLSLSDLSLYDEQFLDAYRPQLSEVVESAVLDWNKLFQLVTTITKKHDAIRVVPLGSLDESLEGISWQLAMLGCAGFADDVKMVRFFSSTQRLESGFRLSVIGSNGHKTSFHLFKTTSQEVRAQQSEALMGLLRSISPGRVVQRAFLELSDQAALIEFVKGTVQLFDLVTMYQKSQGRSSDADVFDSMQAFGQSNLSERIRQLSSDDNASERDLFKAILVTSRSAMSYVHRSSTFAQSWGTSRGSLTCSAASTRRSAGFCSTRHRVHRVFLVQRAGRGGQGAIQTDQDGRPRVRAARNWMDLRETRTSRTMVTTHRFLGI